MHAGGGLRTKEDLCSEPCLAGAVGTSSLTQPGLRPREAEKEKRDARPNEPPLREAVLAAAA